MAIATPEVAPVEEPKTAEPEPEPAAETPPEAEQPAPVRVYEVRRAPQDTLAAELRRRGYPKNVIDNVQKILQGLNDGIHPGRFGGMTSFNNNSTDPGVFRIKVGYEYRMFVKKEDDTWVVKDVLTRSAAQSTPFYSGRS